MLRHTRFLRRLILGVALLSCWQVAQATPTHALTVYGEAPKYPAGFQHFDYVNPNAPKGGSLTRSAEEIGQFNYLNPYVDQGISVVQVDTWVYSPLAYRSLDEPYTVYGLVAEKMEMDPDGLWIRFFLNPKARFEDGKPVTAEDVRYTFELMTTKASFSYRPMFADVKAVTIEGPLQIRFDFKNKLNRMLALDIASLHILPEHWWKTRDFANGGGFEPPLGNWAIPGRQGRRRAQRHLRKSQGLVGQGPASQPWPVQLRQPDRELLRRHGNRSPAAPGGDVRLQPRVLVFRLRGRLQRPGHR